MKSLRLFTSLVCLRVKLLCQYAIFIFFGSPKVPTVEDWARVDVDFKIQYRELWSYYQAFFACRGYILWRRHSLRSFEQIPPNGNPRAPDGFSYGTADSIPHEACWYASSTKLHAARTKDNRDVIVILLGDGVTGKNAIQALELVGSGITAAIDKNHTLPVVDWLRKDNLVFGVFPMVGRFCDLPWFGSVGNILNFMSQIIEGVAFLHRYRIAHRDLFISNFLSSRRSEKKGPRSDEAFLQPRYYIIDFELCVCFPSDVDPNTCTVIGPPIAFENYERPIPPEMRHKDPYCPFKADVWQLGCSFLEIFGHIEEIPEIIRLLQEMRAATPTDRPTAQEALDRLKYLCLSVPSSVTQLVVERLDEPLCEDEDYEYYDLEC